MKILVNATNLSGTGGAAQVADSICRELCRFPQHDFVVVLSPSFSATKEAIKDYASVRVYEYAYPLKDWKSLLTKRNDYLDGLVDSENIDAVLTIFGPTKWVPRCKHLCGFAYPHIPLTDTPYFTRMSGKTRLMAKIRIAYMTYLFKRCSRTFYTENPYITELVKKKLNCKSVYTVTNNYNQVFDHQKLWKVHTLPPFDGIRFFSASSMMSHKNLRITVDIAKLLKQEHPSFKFQFVMTVEKEHFGDIPVELNDCFLFIGGVHISYIPSLYSQCDVVFQPSLLECFSASYPEAMRMEKPLVIPNLDFARGLCHEAAVYYAPLSSTDAAKQLYTVANNPELRKKIVEVGKQQLLTYDTYQQRANKLIHIIEQI